MFSLLRTPDRSEQFLNPGLLGAAEAPRLCQERLACVMEGVIFGGPTSVSAANYGRDGARPSGENK